MWILKLARHTEAKTLRNERANRLLCRVTNLQRFKRRSVDMSWNYRRVARLYNLHDTNFYHCSLPACLSHSRFASAALASIPRSTTSAPMYRA